VTAVSPAHFAFTKLVVADLEASANFYKAVAGLEEDYRVDESIGDRKISEILFKPNFPGAGIFVLFKFLDRDKPENEEVLLGFITDNADAFAERAVAHGGSVVQKAVDMPKHGVRVAFVKDNEGHLLEVVEMLPPPA
jgi:lactoylglutathione lyase